MRKLAKCTFQVVLLLGVAAMSVVACGDTTEPESVASVVVTPSTATLVSLGETVQLTASAQDASGNSVSGKTFTWLSSDANIATVSASGLVTAVANGSVTIMATSDGVSGTAAVDANQVAAQLTFTVQPTDVVAGEAITPAIEVVIQDANGNVVDNATVTVAIGTNPNGGTLSGTTTVNTVSGVASFGDLSIDRDGDDYTLAATAETLASTTSTPFDITQCGVPAPAPARTLCVPDPVGDHTGSIDVVRMVMNYDAVTGDYDIVLTADAANPFVGDFRININLFNPDVGTTALDPSFFGDTVNDYALTSPTTTITLTGTNSVLLSWDVGDRVFTNSLEGTGNPDGVSLFRSAVGNFPAGFLTNEDVIAYGQAALPAIVR